MLEARKELQGTLALLEADLEDLEESVRAVEQTGDRWGIEEHEVRRRRQFVERIKTEVRVRHGSHVHFIWVSLTARACEARLSRGVQAEKSRRRMGGMPGGTRTTRRSRGGA